MPGQNLASWHETLQRTAQLASPHVSCYSLTIEDETAFGRRVARGRMIPVENDAQADFMDSAVQVLAAAQLNRYEVSNYARNGFECKHNLATWRGGNYLACGVGAHGHLRGHRWWNRRDVGGYVAQWQNGVSARAGEENLTVTQRWDELVLMGLRLSEGVNFAQMAAKIGYEIPLHFWRNVEKLARRGVLEAENFSVKNRASGVMLEATDLGEYLPLRFPPEIELQQPPQTRWRLRPAWMAMADAVALELLT